MKIRHNSKEKIGAQQHAQDQAGCLIKYGACAKKRLENAKKLLRRNYAGAAYEDDMARLAK
jgi:hypothetical protein